MYKKLLPVLLLVFPLVCQAQYVSKVWTPDLGNGKYRNPVIHADYSDPDVCAVGNDFYLTASSFNCIPGLPILHSTDLVNWSLIGYGLKSLEPAEVFDSPQHGKGVWAPSIRCHADTLYIYWGDPDYGIFRIWATNATGPWSAPQLVMGGKGLIDPCPLWDTDGRCYLVHAWAGSRAHLNSILTMAELSRDGSHAIGPETIVFDGNIGENHTCEGPKLYKKEGYYYIFCPAGGVATGWQLVMRSKNIYGPYEARKVMAQGKTDVNGPHQGGWVETGNGESWFLHFQDKGAYGRVLHLQPMTWRNGWPVIGVDKDGDGCGEPVTTYRKPFTSVPAKVQNPVESDDFNTTDLGLQWQWQANRQPYFGMTSPYGYLRMYNFKLSRDFVNLMEAPNLLLQKFPAEEFVATARLTVVSKENHQMGGIVVMGLDYCSLTLQREDDHFVLQQVVCHDADKGGKETITPLATFKPTAAQTIKYSPTVSETMYLRVKVSKGAACTFSYSLDGRQFTPCGAAFKARVGKWIGAKVGLLSEEPYADVPDNRGWVDVDSFTLAQ